jgi:carboxylesterase type B
MGYQRQSYVLDTRHLGCIEGVTILSNNRPVLRYFGGIPYALPPIGRYRFRAPRKLPPLYRYGTKANPGRFTGSAATCPQPPSRVPPDAALFDEDCLQLNIWMPADDPKQGSWPVLFYLHGGFLQWGSPNWGSEALVRLISESNFKAIVVMPVYRLNALGFLTGKELAGESQSDDEGPAGNMGFWDQRIALEWVAQNISAFGGDPENITVGGYSAGGLSAYQQLSHELYHKSDAEAIIRRVFMLSNSPGVEPKSLPEHQKQFDEYISRLGIPLELDATQKLERLRALPYQSLIDVQSKMTISEFRALADGHFYPQDLVRNINNGDFARRMKSRNITLLMGECKEEHASYRGWRTPENTYSGVYTRLSGEYSERVAQKLMEQYCGLTQSLPSCYKDWQDLFGYIYADIQVYHLERGFLNALFQGGLKPGKDVLRYRFDRRLECVAEIIPIEWGVTHATDVPIWFWGQNLSSGLTDQEKIWLGDWNRDFAAYVDGKTANWGLSKPNEMRRWRSDGETDVWEDDKWERGLRVWEILNGGH